MTPVCRGSREKLAWPASTGRAGSGVGFREELADSGSDTEDSEDPRGKQRVEGREVDDPMVPHHHTSEKVLLDA